MTRFSSSSAFCQTELLSSLSRSEALSSGKCMLCWQSLSQYCVYLHFVSLSLSDPISLLTPSLPFFLSSLFTLFVFPLLSCSLVPHHFASAELSFSTLPLDQPTTFLKHCLFFGFHRLLNRHSLTHTGTLRYMQTSQQGEEQGEREGPQSTNWSSVSQTHSNSVSCSADAVAFWLLNHHNQPQYLWPAHNQQMRPLPALCNPCWARWPLTVHTHTVHLLITLKCKSFLNGQR